MLGRLTTYVLLGALFGAAGGAAFAAAIAPVQLALYVVANLLLLALAAGIAARSGGSTALERLGLTSVPAPAAGSHARGAA